MRPSPRRRRALRLATAAVALAALLPAPVDPARGVLAGGVCPTGTNWDNRIRACR
ncbi:hypothetical protein FHU28_002362 [Micromonospora echinospora]|uniref:Uncharacterized protein n=1 Tax=Micromonospora echinospora TaxID=1877 RepID=A0ABR6MAW8_MICEC|nr:hypothetical protein [Micromonospora echinospora]MBB5112523.1 hypothetical protein [Micromonospora echinospora]